MDMDPELLKNYEDARIALLAEIDRVYPEGTVIAFGKRDSVNQGIVREKGRYYYPGSLDVDTQYRNCAYVDLSLVIGKIHDEECMEDWIVSRLKTDKEWENVRASMGYKRING